MVRRYGGGVDRACNSSTQVKNAILHQVTLFAFASFYFHIQYPSETVAHTDDGVSRRQSKYKDEVQEAEKRFNAAAMLTKTV